jgi:hypothetical protein
MQRCYSAEELSFRTKEQMRAGHNHSHIIEEATVDQWKDFSARHGYCLEHYLDVVNKAEQDRRVRVVLANQRRKTPFFAPVLATLGKQMVIWGSRLRARYEQAGY